MLTEATAALKFINLVLDIVAKKRGLAKGSRPLFRAYVALKSFQDAKSSFLEYVDGPLQSVIPGGPQSPTVLLEANRRAETLARRQFEFVEMTRGLHVLVRPFDPTLHQLLVEHHARVSKSLGYSAQQVAAHTAFRTIGRDGVKLNTLRGLYRVTMSREGAVRVGKLDIHADSEWSHFVDLYQGSQSYFDTLSRRLEEQIRVAYEMSDVL